MTKEELLEKKNTLIENINNELNNISIPKLSIESINKYYSGLPLRKLKSLNFANIFYLIDNFIPSAFWDYGKLNLIIITENNKNQLYIYNRTKCEYEKLTNEFSLSILSNLNKIFKDAKKNLMKNIRLVKEYKNLFSNKNIIYDKKNKKSLLVKSIDITDDLTFKFKLYKLYDFLNHSCRIRDGYSFYMLHKEALIRLNDFRYETNISNSNVKNVRKRLNDIIFESKRKDLINDIENKIIRLRKLDDEKNKIDENSVIDINKFRPYIYE